MLTFPARVAIIGLGCWILQLLGGCAAGHKPTSASNESLSLRVYDVRDLIVAVPDFDAAPDWHLSTRETSTSRPATRPATVVGLFDEPRETPSRQQRIDDLIATLRREPLPWVDGSSIRELSGQLVIKTTTTGHNKVTQLLSDLREKRDTQITVEARFIAVDPAELEKPGLFSAEKLAEWKRLTGAGRPATEGPLTLTDLQVAELLRFVQANGERTSLLTTPRITLFNGQRASVVVANQQAYVSDYAPKTVDGKTAYEPVGDNVSIGFAMDVRATASPDRRSVTLVLRPQISRLVEMRSFPWPQRPAGSELMIQQPKLDVSEIHATVAVTNNQTAVFTGLREIEAKPNTPTTRPAGERTVLLLVRPTILPARETTKSWPLLSTKKPD